MSYGVGEYVDKVR